mmetsp:Transcript_20729/g.44818  ORF Transcript_20729/g.44818 Transcript_20729/m.44818 type:complete len:96 (+) Transcript_20729:668-955(+)
MDMEEKAIGKQMVWITDQNYNLRHNRCFYRNVHCTDTSVQLEEPEITADAISTLQRRTHYHQELVVIDMDGVTTTFLSVSPASFDLMPWTRLLPW